MNKKEIKNILLSLTNKANDEEKKKITFNLEFFTGKIYLKIGGKIKTLPEKQNLR